jgi:hypothetical protein
MLASVITRLGFLARRPWISRFTIAGRDYGGRYDVTHDPRLGHFFRCFPGARRVLELGSLEGAHTFALAARVAEVHGIEGRAANLRKARFVQRRLGCRNVTFHQADLEAFDPAALGRFDAVFCSGLLYHLPRPWELLARLRGAADGLLLATHYAPADKADEERNGYAGTRYHEFGLKEPLSGLSPESFWPTLDALARMVRDAGYSAVEVCDDDRAHPHGPLVTLAARA